MSELTLAELEQWHRDRYEVSPNDGYVLHTEAADLLAATQKKIDAADTQRSVLVAELGRREAMLTRAWKDLQTAEADAKQVREMLEAADVEQRRLVKLVNDAEAERDAARDELQQAVKNLADSASDFISDMRVDIRNGLLSVEDAADRATARVYEEAEQLTPDGKHPEVQS